MEVIFAAAATAISGAAQGLALGTILLMSGVSLALSGLSLILTKSSKTTSTTSTSESINRSFRVSKAPRHFVYGEVRKSGSIAYLYGSTDNQYLHAIIRIASHEIEGIDEYIVGEESITPDMMDSDGNVISGTYSGLLRLRAHLGAADQVADAFLVAESPEWTSSHRLQGVAYIYMRAKWDSDVWTFVPSEQISCWLRGKKVLDVRDDTTKWTPNLSLILRDYMIEPFLVLQTNEEHINDTDCSNSANVCDEMVSVVPYSSTISSVSGNILSIEDDNDRLYFQRGDCVTLEGSDLPSPLAEETDYYVIPYQREGTPRLKLAESLDDAISNTEITLSDEGSGSMTITKNSEPRYHGGGTFVAGENAKGDIESILAGMAGNAYNTDGSWRIIAGCYQTPTVYLDEGDLRSEITVSTKVSRSERFNEVQGTYISPINAGQESDYPLVTRSEYVDEDNMSLRKVLDLAVTQRPHTAERIAMIALDRSRMDIVFQASFSLSALKLSEGDNFYFSFPLYGWENMVFEVTEWTLKDKDGAPIIEMTCRQNTADIYSWISSYETPVNTSMRTSLPSAFLVPVVTDIGIDSKHITTLGDDVTFQIAVSWAVSSNYFVSNGGKYEIQYKKSAESGWVSIAIVDGSSYSTIIYQLEKDVYYDIRIRAINSLGIKSNWTTLEGYLAGQTVIPDSEDWESQTVSGRDGSDLESDTEASEDWET